MVEVQDSKLLSSIVKVGSLVEEATRTGNRSGKSMEEEHREAEKKVIWIFQKFFLIKLSSGGGVRQVCVQLCEGGEGEAEAGAGAEAGAELVLEQQEQEVNLCRPDPPGLTFSIIS